MATARTPRQVRRFHEIVAVFVRHGFDDIVSRLHLMPNLAFGRWLSLSRRGGKAEALTAAERLRLAFQELGPTFIKFGQGLSLRADVLPPDLVAELSRLQDEVPPLEPGQAEAAVEAELGAPLTQIFCRVDPVPIAAASISQVHHATLVTGEEVAVKVRRPNIAEVIDSDVVVLGQLARLVERHFADARLYGPSNLVAQFAHSIRLELNLAREGRVIDTFRQNFAGDSTVLFPKVFWKQTTAGVLTLEYMRGIKITDVLKEEHGFDVPLIVQRSVDAVLKQILIHGLFHADPHPANVFVLPGNVICFLDFGNVGRLERSTREVLAGLAKSLARRDVDRLAEGLLAIAPPSGEINTRAFRQDLAELLDNYGEVTLGNLSIGELLRDVVEILSHHRLQFPPDLLQLVKAFLTVEGVGRQLDPSFKLVEHARPLVERVLEERLMPSAVAARVVELGHEAAEVLQTMPRDFMEIARKVRTDGLQIQFVHRNLEHFVQEMNRSSNRLSFAIVIAALIVGSSLILQSNMGPHIFGHSALGLGGFLAAAFVGMQLAIGILRSGRL